MDKDKHAKREAMAEQRRMNVGDIRRELEGLKDDCEVHFSSFEGELFFCLVKVRGREPETDRPTLVSFELAPHDDD